MERSSRSCRSQIIENSRQCLLLRTDIQVLQKNSRWVPLVLDCHVELNLGETFLDLADELSHTQCITNIVNILY